MQQVLRLEKKYLLTLEEARRMSGKLQQIMHQDPHNGAEGYLIRSLYFDTIVDGDYFDKLDGLEVRRKLRLRCYDPEDAFAKLEMKQKQGEQQKKRSLKLSREEAEALCGGMLCPDADAVLSPSQCGGISPYGLYCQGK